MATTTINAIALETGYLASPISTATYVIASGAAAPDLSPAPGAYTTTQSVQLTDTTAGATIYYTTDGTTPTHNSAVYSAPITVATTTTINAIGSAPGMADSELAPPSTRSILAARLRSTLALASAAPQACS